MKYCYISYKRISQNANTLGNFHTQVYHYHTQTLNVDSLSYITFQREAFQNIEDLRSPPPLSLI